QPQGDHLDACLAAPAEQLEDVIGALLMAGAHVGEARRPCPPPVAVQDHPDVPRDRVPGERRFQLPLIQPVDEIAKSHPHPFSAARLSAAVTPQIGRSAAAPSLAAGPSCCCSVAALLSAGAHPAGPNAPAGARPPLPARWTRA